MLASFIRRHFFFCIVVASALAVWAVVRELPPGFLKWRAMDIAADKLEEALGVRVSVGDITFDRQRSRIELAPVVVHGTDGTLLFAAQRVRVDVASVGLRARHVVLENVELTGPRLALRIVDGVVRGVPAGDEEADKAPGEPERSQGRLDLKHLRVHGGHVTLELVNGDVPLVVVLAGIDASLDARDEPAAPSTSSGLGALGGRHHDTTTSVARTTIARPRDVTVLAPWTARATLIGDTLLDLEQVVLAPLRLATGDTLLDVEGTIGLPRDGKPEALDLKLSGSTPLTQITKYGDVPVRLGGRLKLAAHLLAPAGMGTLTAAGDGELADFAVDRMRLGTIRGAFKADGDGMVIDPGSWALAETTVHGALQARFVEGVPLKLQARGKRFSFYKLFQQLAISPGPWMDAKVDGAVDVGGTLSPFLIQGRGKGTIRELVSATRDVRKAAVKDWVIAAPRPVEADVTIRVNGGGMRFEGVVHDNLSRFQGYCDLSFNQERGIDLTARSESFASQSIGHRLALLDVTGLAKGTMRIAGPYVHPIITADASAVGLTLEGFLLGDVKGHVDGDGHIVRFTDLIVKKGASRYAGDIELNFSRILGGVPPQIRADVDLEGARIEDLRAMIPKRVIDPGLVFSRDLDVTGPIAGRLHIEGPAGEGKPEELSGAGQIIAKPGIKVFGQPLGGGNIRFHFDRGSFFIDQMGFDAGEDEEFDPRAPPPVCSPFNGLLGLRPCVQGESPSGLIDPLKLNFLNFLNFLNPKRDDGVRPGDGGGRPR